MNKDSIEFFASDYHSCGYLPNQVTTTVFARANVPITTMMYNKLVEYGFRRSGEHIYVPQCPNCKACIPARIPVNAFEPTRNQTRVIKKHASTNTVCLPAAFHPEHFDLYRRYISSRHAGGGMDNPNPQNYMDFLTSQWCDTWFIEFRVRENLIAVCVADQLPRGLSAVYTFFDPDAAPLSPGVNAILF